MANLDPVVQNPDNIIHRMNHYPVNKFYENKLCYPVDKDLFYGYYPPFEQLGPGVVLRQHQSYPQGAKKLIFTACHSGKL